MVMFLDAASRVNPMDVGGEAPLERARARVRTDCKDGMTRARRAHARAKSTTTTVSAARPPASATPTATSRAMRACGQYR